MSEARARAEWGRASNLMALIARVNGNKNASPSDFNPFTDGASAGGSSSGAGRFKLTADNVAILRAFVPVAPPRKTC